VIRQMPGSQRLCPVLAATRHLAVDAAVRGRVAARAMPSALALLRDPCAVRFVPRSRKQTVPSSASVGRICRGRPLLGVQPTPQIGTSQSARKLREKKRRHILRPNTRKGVR